MIISTEQGFWTLNWLDSTLRVSLTKVFKQRLYEACPVAIETAVHVDVWSIDCGTDKLGIRGRIRVWARIVADAEVRRDGITRRSKQSTEGLLTEYQHWTVCAHLRPGWSQSLWEFWWHEHCCVCSKARLIYPIICCKWSACSAFLLSLTSSHYPL